LNDHLKSVMQTQSKQRRLDHADGLYTTAWLRALLAAEREACERAPSLSEIKDVALESIGEWWFNDMFQTCPYQIATAIVPKMTLPQMTKLGPGGAIFSRLLDEINGVSDAPIIVLFDSPVDGLGLMTAHLDTGVEVKSFALHTQVKAVANDRYFEVVLQPAKDVAHYIVNCKNWCIGENW